MLVKLSFRLFLMLLHYGKQLLHQKLSLLNLNLNVFKNLVDIFTDCFILQHINQGTLDTIFNKIEDYAGDSFLVILDADDFDGLLLHKTERNLREL